jgi:AcrR family transcriptional regulator
VTVAKTDLAATIQKKTLDLLMNREPEEISMRNIARECGVSATSLYYYYKDKESLFEVVKLNCLNALDDFITKSVKPGGDPVAAMRVALGAFRDWAFANPRMSLLIMGRLKANTEANQAQLEKYYRSTMLGKKILDGIVAAGKSKSKDTLLGASLCIAALWGAIEQVLFNRTIPKYWNKGILFTNKMIDFCCSAILINGEKNEK